MTAALSAALAAGSFAAVKHWQDGEGEGDLRLFIDRALDAVTRPLALEATGARVRDR